MSIFYVNAWFKFDNKNKKTSRSYFEGIYV